MKTFLLAVGLSLIITSPAFAFKECGGTIQYIYRENGFIWVQLNEGGVAKISDTDLAAKDYMAMLITAKATKSPVVFRYWNDAAVCSAVNTDLQGLWLR